MLISRYCHTTTCTILITKAESLGLVLLSISLYTVACNGMGYMSGLSRAMLICLTEAYSFQRMSSQRGRLLIDLLKNNV